MAQKPPTAEEVKAAAKAATAKTVDGRKYFRLNGRLYVETEAKSNTFEISKRNQNAVRRAQGQIEYGQVNRGLKNRMLADKPASIVNPEGITFGVEGPRGLVLEKAGDQPVAKKSVGRPRKDGKVNKGSAAKAVEPKSDTAAKLDKSTKKTLAELGADKAKKPRTSLKSGATPTRTRPIGGPSAPKAEAPKKRTPKPKAETAPKTKPKAPAKPKIDRSAEKPLTSRSSGLSDAELKAKLAEAKFKVDKAPKTRAKGKTPGTSSKPSTTPSRPRNRAPKVEKPVSPRMQGSPQAAEIKKMIEKQVAAGKRKVLVKSEPMRLEAKKRATPQSEAKKTTPAGKKAAPKKTTVKKTTPARPPRKPSVGTPLTNKQAASQRAAATRAANKAKPSTPVKRLPGNTFEEKLKNFKGERVTSGAKWIKVGSKVARVAGPAARVIGRFAGPAGVVLTAAEAARLGTTAQGQREYADMRRAIDMGMRGKDVKGKDLVRKGTIYTSTADARKEAATAKRKKLASASAKAGDARANAMNRQAYKYTISKGPRPSGESYSPSKKQSPSNKGSNRPSTPMTGKVVRVQRGGTLWDIAQKNNTTVSALYKANPELARRRAAGRTVLYSNTAVRVPRKK